MSRWLAIIVFLHCILAATWASAEGDQGIHFFEKNIRPLLAQQCVSCHGPQKQKAGLRLDSPDAVRKGSETGAIIKPRDPAGSLLYKVVCYDDEIRMPPRGKLSDESIQHIRKWIELGCPMPKEEKTETASKPGNSFDLVQRQKHWCYQPLQHPKPPQVKGDDWSLHPLDRFIYDSLSQAGLKPAADAEKTAWLRRVTFDLTGLPPTLKEISHFLEDGSPGSHARVVDRLLADSAYGERWGRHWLDLMRYADTLGHEFDFDLPQAWRYRNYVIRALNDDIPYSQLVLEHLAGDLLPQPRANDTLKTNESIQATAFLWLGEAKQAPVDVRQEQADRIDNQIDVIGKAFLGQTIACARCHDHKFDPIATRDYYALYGVLKNSRYQQAIIDLPEKNQDELSALDKIHQELQRALFSTPVILENWNDLAFKSRSPAHGPQFNVLPLQAAMPQGPAWKRFNHAAITSFTHPKTKAPALRIIPAGAWDSGTQSQVLEGSLQTLTFSIKQRYLHIHAAGWGGRIRVVVDGFVVIRDPIYGGLRKLINNPNPAWYTFDLNMWPGRQAYVEFLDGGPPDLSLTRDGAPGKEAWLQVRQMLISDQHQPPQDTTVAALEQQLLAQITPMERAWKASYDARQKAEQQIPAPSYTLATADGNGDNESVFIRGNHRNLGEIAPRGLSSLYCGKDPMPVGSGSGRLELAQRLIDPERNPLIARVIVNRLWKLHFGNGLVRSVDDFGHMGEPPTHPQLLDFLARWFIDNNWSMKKLHREIVLSRTYRQTSGSHDPKAAQVDPQNRLLHHMPIRRLEAEAVRDAMLALSGQLNRTPADEGVMPWLTSYMQGRGRPSQSGPLDGNGRRSIYLSVRRNFLSPLFTAFDFPTPFTAIGKRSMSNIPSQSLTMMNDPLVKELSEKWAKRMIKEYPDQQTRLIAMCKMAFGHQPGEEMNRALQDYLGTAHATGVQENRAWTDVAHALICSKEFIYVP